MQPDGTPTPQQPQPQPQPQPEPRQSSDLQRILIGALIAAGIVLLVLLGFGALMMIFGASMMGGGYCR